MYSAKDIEEKQYDDDEPIHGFPPGLSILAGDPKVGKSWYALNMLVATAKQGNKVLYLALEDTERRIKNRLEILEQGFPKGLNITHEAQSQELIETWMSANPDTKMIVIDTIEQFEPGGLQGYTRSVETLNTLHKITEQHPKLLIVLLHHTNKNSKGFNKILGSSGVTGSVDTLALLERDSMTDRMTLYLTGRDVEQSQMDMQFNDGSFLVENEDQTKMVDFHFHIPKSVYLGVVFILGFFILAPSLGHGG